MTPAPRPQHAPDANDAADSLDSIEDLDLVGALADEMVEDFERYLAGIRRTAHPLVTATTDELVAAALANLAPAPAGQHPAEPQLPRGLWRLLPARFLALHPARHFDAGRRRTITPAEHLDLTVLLLRQWGWSQTGGHIRTLTGRRCIVGAQYALFRLGYGTEHTAVAAGQHIDNVLRSRGIQLPYVWWNEQSHVGPDQVLAVVQAAAVAARA
jgi:hypothetical protein